MILTLDNFFLPFRLNALSRIPRAVLNNNNDNKLLYLILYGNWNTYNVSLLISGEYPLSDEIKPPSISCLL